MGKIEPFRGKVKNKSVFKQKRPVPWTFLTVVVLVLVGITLLITQCRIETMKVKGNVHYTNKQIRKIIKSSLYIDNSIFLTAKNKVIPVKKLPFIEKVKVQWDNRNQVTIVVQEKQMTACVANGKKYIYFDNDGVVTDNETRYLSDIPVVEGLEFKKFSIGRKLPVTNEGKFQIVLDITRSMTKSGMKLQKILLTKEDQIYLYQKKVCVQMGTSYNMEIKLANLPDMMRQADGLDGTLHMENYSEQNRIVSFIKDEKPKIK